MTIIFDGLVVVHVERGDTRLTLGNHGRGFVPLTDAIDIRITTLS